MLNLMRRGVKTWVAKILLFLLIISFAVWGIGDIFLGANLGTVAHVGDTEIDANRYARNVQRQQHQITVQRRQGVTLDDMRAAGLDRQILASLVREATYTEELAKLDISVGPNEVAKMIRLNPAFLTNEGQFDLNRYRERLTQLGYDGPGFETAMRAALAQGILTGAVRVGTMPDGTAEAIAKWQGESRGITTLALTPDKAPDPGEPSDTDLSTFFEADKEPFREPERRWGRYIRISAADLVTGIKPTDEEIEAEYNARIEAYTAQPKRTVEQIVFPDEAQAKAAAKRIADGSSSFAEIAAEQNISVADLSLGEVGQNELATAVDTAVFALTEPGIAGPVQVLDGHALLNVTAVTTGGTRPFAEVKDEVAAGLAVRHATGLASQKASEIAELRAGGDSLEDVAKKLGVPLLEIGGLAVDGSAAEGEPPMMIADPVFMAEVQQAGPGLERDVIELATGGFAVVSIDRVAEPHLPKLETIKEKVTAAWKAEQRIKALEARAKELVEKAGTEGMAAIGTELGDTPVEMPAALRNQLPPILDQDLRVRIFTAEKDAILVDRSAGDQSVVIILVREIVPLAGETLTERVTAVEQAMSGSLADDTQEFFARALEVRHEAQVNQGAIDGVFERLGHTGY